MSWRIEEAHHLGFSVLGAIWASFAGPASPLGFGLVERWSWGRAPQFGSFDPAGWNISAFWAATTGTARLLCCPMCHCQSGMHLKTLELHVLPSSGRLWLHFCSGFALVVSSERKKIRRCPRLDLYYGTRPSTPVLFMTGSFMFGPYPTMFFVFFSVCWIWHHLYLAAPILSIYRERSENSFKCKCAYEGNSKPNNILRILWEKGKESIGQWKTQHYEC